MLTSTEDKWHVDWDGMSLPGMGINYTEKLVVRESTTCICQMEIS